MTARSGAAGTAGRGYRVDDVRAQILDTAVDPSELHGRSSSDRIHTHARFRNDGGPWSPCPPTCPAVQDSAAPTDTEREWPDAVLVEGDWVSPARETHSRDLLKAWADAAANAGCPPAFVVRMREFVGIHDRLAAAAIAALGGAAGETETVRWKVGDPVGVLEVPGGYVVVHADDLAALGSQPTGGERTP